MLAHSGPWTQIQSRARDVFHGEQYYAVALQSGLARDMPTNLVKSPPARRKRMISHSVTASSLIVVSNRLPFVLKRTEDDGLVRKPSAGGLVTAVAPVVVQSGGLWVGWPGLQMKETDSVPESVEGDVSPTAGLKSSQVLSVNLDDVDYELYYNGCCNATFWPLFHSMPDRAIFNEKFWMAYKKVNEDFSEITLKALRKMQTDHPEQVPLVWIHDYHLMLAANTIRQKAEEENLQCKIGFFLHIPFPPWDIMKIFPWEDMILQGILACDLVGFHVEDYCLNFLDSCQRGLGSRVDRKLMLAEHGGRTVRIRPLPIGIPFSRFDQMAHESPNCGLDTNNVKVVLGVDRLDYTKGLVNRLQAFERLLEEFPEHIGKIMLMQVAVPSRTDVKEYIDLKEDMDKLVGQINGKFSTPTWSPIRYIYGCISQQELAGYYRDADVALVTPMRDGMNLVAKEFVACRIRDPGVLILSPFAGAGGMMHEALLVNPYEIGTVAKVLHRALTMPHDEREVRMNALRAREKIYDVNFWMKSFLKSIGTLIEEDGEDVTPTQMQPVSFDDFNSYLGPYVGDRAILSLLLDYDGTLAPIAKHPDLAVMPTETKKVLERLANHPDVFIAIVSGRSVNNVKEMVGINGITYAGNHGLEILHSDGTKFVHPMPESQGSKVKALVKNLQTEVCQDGAWVEEKGVLLTYHYREVAQEKREALVTKAKDIITQNGFKIGLAHCALECKPPVVWDKGRASIYILRTAFGVDWSERIRIIFAGDDVTDEDAIMALKGMAFTFRIVSDHLTKTCADKRLPSTDSVLTLLKWVERHMASRLTQGKSPVEAGKVQPIATDFHVPTHSIVTMPI
ncbi:uncharacterized protein LOC131882533 isoform X3 [Tigriopus californicus]|uniref:uncharacterized protein LOC131882533 isoform X3 n=1 Tax=Tigriopus californicus TaxID=6832 RepID=UPI0027DAA6F5|nr:uncharacterized protein LOC131882533 isoform X3 [Tigriopus californicus]